MFYWKEIKLQKTGLLLCIHRHFTGSPVNVYKVSLYSLHLGTAKNCVWGLLSVSSENIYCFLQEEHSVKLRLNILLLSVLFGCWNDFVIYSIPSALRKKRQFQFAWHFLNSSDTWQQSKFCPATGKILEGQWDSIEMPWHASMQLDEVVVNE